MVKAAAAPKGKIPMKEFIVRRQEEAGLKNLELAEMTGYESPNVIAMIRNGSMAFPINKTRQFAKALKVDPVFMLMRALESRNPELLEVLEDIVGNSMVTELEVQVIKAMRKELDGVEFDIKQHPDFMTTVRPALQKIAEREKALHAATIDQAKRNYKPGPKKAA